MIARWMAGAILFSACLALAALAAEQVLRVRRRATRPAWVVAIIGSAVWPLVAPLLLTAPLVTDVVTVGSPVVLSGGTAASRGRFAALAPHIDQLLLLAWGLATAVLLTHVLVALRTLRQVRQRARTVDLDGETVLVDAQVGPAVIGLRRPQIVVPAWVLDLDDTLRGLVLRHEREHCVARDAHLVWLGVLCTTALPFNLALWWMARRMRSAMEVDCDARTLRHEVDRTRYARLLLLIAQRHHTARLMPALSSTASQLTRRIAAMQTAPLRFRTARVVAASAVGVAALIAACSPRIATNLTSPAPVPDAAVSRQSEAASPTAPATDTVPSADAPANREAALLPTSIMPSYPAALRDAKVTGNVFTQFVVNADGTVDASTLKVLRTSLSDNAPADASAVLVATVRASLDGLRYAPARVNGRNVRQLVSMPFAFQLSTPSAQAMPTTSPLPYFDFQVEKPATPVAGSRGPLYPLALREAGIQGQVLAQFVVNPDGTVDLSSFKAVKSDHAEFSAAVRAALADMRFEPARVGGKAVKQLLQTPFVFSLSR